MQPVVAWASCAVLAALAFAGLGRLRARRFRAAVPGGARPARGVEAALFASLLGVALAGVAEGPAWLALATASSALVACAIAAWLLSERADPGAARRPGGPFVAALALAAAAGGLAAGAGTTGALASALVVSGVAYGALRGQSAAGGTPELASALVLLGAALALDAAASGAPAGQASAGSENARAFLGAAAAVCAACAGAQLFRFAGAREHPRATARAPGGPEAFVAEREL